MVVMVKERLKQHFRPEFLNRVDEVLFFHRLGHEHMAAIVTIQLRRLNELIGGQGLTLEATNAAIEHLAREGFDPDFGARPLKRTIQRLVQDPLANMVLAGEVGDGQRIVLDVAGGELRLQPETNSSSDAGRKAEPDDVEMIEAEIVG
jgi:ATP-dependent Clp protease ATP-binding subunit ClpB